MKPLALLLLFSGAMLASPILIGAISLTGSGTLQNPDTTPYGAEGLGGIMLTINASGSSGGHTVSMNSGAIPLYGGAGGPPPIGADLIFNMPTVWSCTHEVLLRVSI